MAAHELAKKGICVYDDYGANDGHARVMPARPCKQKQTNRHTDRERERERNGNDDQLVATQTPEASLLSDDVSEDVSDEDDDDEEEDWVCPSDTKELRGWGGGRVISW